MLDAKLLKPRSLMETETPTETVDFPSFVDGAQGQYVFGGETLLCMFFPCPCCFAVFSRQIQYNWIVFYKNMLTTCTCLSVKFAYSSNTACKGPDLKGNF